MMLTPTLTLSVFTMLFSQTRLSERKLADIAVIGIPRSVKEEMYKGIADDQQGRLTFTFSTSYFWASFGSGTAYKHQLFVGVMAPDASDAEYKEYPKWYSLSYDRRTTVSTQALGSGTLRVEEGNYTQNSLHEPSHTFFYTDRARRLQIVWHAVKKEVDLADGTELIGRMAASFKIVRDPTARYAEMRDRPRKEAENLANRRATAMEMLKREGYGPLEQGKPVFKNGVYVEWMSDPEPRFQLLVPLGRVRVSNPTNPGTRPRPVRRRELTPLVRNMWGSIGWREFADGEWGFSNDDNAYLPMDGIAAKLAADLADPAFMSFYYSATVRVDHEPDETWLTHLRWFFEGVPDVQRLWKEGKLVVRGTPERD